MNLDDTIVAIATPPGRGGIGVVRVAGPQARAISAGMLRLRHRLEPSRAQWCDLIEAGDADSFGREVGASGGIDTDADTGQAKVPPPHTQGAELRVEQAEHRLHSSLDLTRIDEVVVTYFARPHSYTTDDIIEISAHGSPVVLRHIVEMALARGARLAEPGEFTMRAFLNGRLDLTQAEAVCDLIDAQTLFQAKVAAQQLEGALSHRLKPIKKKLIELIALLEAGIDFAEDDISVAPDAIILGRIGEVRIPLEQLAGSFAYGKIVHQGLTLAIVGRPNVGKSSLFNRLVERERSIVTATPGTTRDLVSETVSIGGIPVELVDTAGIRRALDEAESIGIKKSMEALADADLVLIVTDKSQLRSEEDEELLRAVEGRPAIVVENKSDLAGTCGDFTASSLMFTPRIATSAVTGDGIPALRTAILNHIAGDSTTTQETGFLTSVRHRKLVDDALSALNAATKAVGAKVPHEMVLLDLYGALRALDEITGVTTTDDILNLIFSSFCIGK